MNSNIPRRMRILYMAGPGDVIGTYRCWRRGEDDPAQIALTDSGQFYDVCQELGVRARVVAYHSRLERIQEGLFDIEHRRMLLQSARGPLYHLGQYWFNLSVVFSAIGSGCNLILPMSQSHLSPYWIARLFGISVIPVEQCVLWPKFDKPRGLNRIVAWLDRLFFAAGCDAIISMSQDITDQINELTHGRHATILPFLPSYRRSTFEDIPPADTFLRPFRVLFAGRVEIDKGVFDLVEIAQDLARIGRQDIVIDVAGDGSALPELKARVEKMDLGHLVNIWGYCERPKMQLMLQQSHAVIVPTRTDFIEGFNKVVAEAVLARRPFVTSSVCPALEYVRTAGLEVPPDNPSAYTKAILQLADDSDLYSCKFHECERLREQFFDEERGWAATLKKILLRRLAPQKLMDLNPGDEMQTPSQSSSTIAHQF